MIQASIMARSLEATYPEPVEGVVVGGGYLHGHVLFVYISDNKNLMEYTVWQMKK